jgi:hypothetical protein
LSSCDPFTLPPPTDEKKGQKQKSGQGKKPNNVENKKQKVQVQPNTSKKVVPAGKVASRRAGT